MLIIREIKSKIHVSSLKPFILSYTFFKPDQTSMNRILLEHPKQSHEGIICSVDYGDLTIVLSKSATLK